MHSLVRCTPLQLKIPIISKLALGMSVKLARLHCGLEL